MSKKERGCWIYRITNLDTKKVYIGRTIRCYNLRFREHLNVNSKGSSFLKNSVKKHGKENFIIEPLFFCFEDYSKFEEFFIKQNRCIYPLGYNSILLDENTPIICQETRKKMSLAKKNTSQWNKGKTGLQEAWNKGKPNLRSSRAITRVCVVTKRVKYYNSSMDAVRDGFNSGHVIACCKGKLEKHKGYNWYYTEEYINE